MESYLNLRSSFLKYGELMGMNAYNREENYTLATFAYLFVLNQISSTQLSGSYEETQVSCLLYTLNLFIL